MLVIEFQISQGLNSLFFRLKNLPKLLYYTKEYITTITSTTTIQYTKN